ncbi:MAG: rRNA large subunit methyltransferase I, partial [Lachnospiraceae bacterium]|nr:rRNA large subunit methyltransferase I [Lachnospiraceae bacterium]
MDNQSNAKVILKKGEGRTIKAGGAWIYDNEIEKIEGEFENGDVVEVRDFDGYVMGKGFVNTNSKLTVRMLSRRKDAV